MRKNEGQNNEDTEDIAKWFLNRSAELYNDDWINLSEKGSISLIAFIVNNKKKHSLKEIKDNIINLQEFQHIFPYQMLVGFNEKPYQWKTYSNEIRKGCLLEEWNNSFVNSLISRNLRIVISSNYVEQINNNVIFTDTRILNIVETLLFLNTYYSRFQIENNNNLVNVNIIFSGMKNLKLLTPFEREIGKELHPFISSEDYLFSNLTVNLKDIENNLLNLTENLLIDFFSIYDASEYLEKNISEIISNYMKKRIFN